MSMNTNLDLEPVDTEKQPQNKKFDLMSELFDWLEVFVLSISLVFILFTFFFRVAIVDGPSMKDTLHHGETLVVSELFYQPKQGDVVVFQSPKMGYGEPLVKRIIATEGQTVEIDFDNWTVYVDGEAIDEPYVRRVTAPMIGWSYGDSITVPEGCVFVMGDNRNQSTDSRSSLIGAVDERYIIGKVVFRFYPFSELGFIN